MILQQKLISSKNKQLKLNFPETFKQVEFFLLVPMLPQVCVRDCLRQKEVDRPLRRGFHRVLVLPNKPKIKIPFVKEFYFSLSQYIVY